jgi:hypothetical protein
MNPINQAAILMGKRKITRRATAKSETSESCIFLWELDDGATLELVRDTAFKSVRERNEGFDQLLAFYQRGRCKVFSPNNVVAA